MIGGCFPPIDLTGRACPCDQGWVCERDRCVRAGEELDAGELDAGGVEEDAGTARCPAGAFCEDFESPSMGTNGWTPFPDWIEVTYIDPRDGAQPVSPYRGSGMLRARTTTKGSAADIVVCPFDEDGTAFCPEVIPDAGVTPDGGIPALPGITSGDIWMRAYVFAPSTLTTGDPFEIGHASILYAGAHRGPWLVGEEIVGFNLDVGRSSMYVGTIGQRIELRPADGEADTRPVFPMDEWVCVRVHIHVDPVDGSVASYVGPDETPEVERSAIDTVPEYPWLHFGVGLGYTSEMPNGAELYFDEVAFHTEPLDCLE